MQISTVPKLLNALCFRFLAFPASFKTDSFLLACSKSDPKQDQDITKCSGIRIQLPADLQEGAKHF